MSDGGGTQIGRFCLAEYLSSIRVGSLALALLEDCFLLPEMKQLH